MQARKTGMEGNSLKELVHDKDTEITPLQESQTLQVKQKFPRIMISATSSGSGKTLITCGLLKALKNRKKKVTAFKGGPDFIDPMFHKKILHTPSRNLDTFFTDEETTRYLFTNAAKNFDLSVIEGVMGYYDGVGGISDQASAYDIAKTLETPVILVINGKGMSLSIAAIIKGFLEYREESNIKGVILNQVSNMIYPELKTMIEKELNLKVLGYVPKVDNLVIESRHLGLVLPDEIMEIEHRIEELALLLEETLDIDEIIAIANQVNPMKTKELAIPKLAHAPTIAVALDEAFCFYYEDNLKLMKKMGANLVEFSPLHDAHLPANINGLILGGGYPELYTKQLSENVSMRSEINQYFKENCSILAECGGFMYLHDEMEDQMGIEYPMVGAIHGKAFKTSKLGRFGYITLSPQKEQAFFGIGETIKGHEFHYWDSTNCGVSYQAKKPLRKKEWDCIHAKETMCVGFPHLYYYSNLSFIYRFLDRCR
jgi:cobyrinic acid a,c-diamide synthase